MQKTNQVIKYKIFLMIFIISFTVFVFTSQGHRYSSDEYFTFNQAYRIATQTEIEGFEPGVTKPTFTIPSAITHSRPVCYDAILCSSAPIGHSVSYVPFILIQNIIDLIPEKNFTVNDFDDPHYVSWRNSLSKSETFTFIYFGALVTSLSISILFLIICSYGYSFKTGLTVAFLYGFTTIAWAYSATGMNVSEATMFILLGFLFFRNFKKSYRVRDLFLCGSSLAFAFTVRYDIAFFILILFGFILFDLIKNRKIKKIFPFILPILFVILVVGELNIIRFGSVFEFGYGSTEGLIQGHTTPPQIGILGLLISPGVGLFVFSPILLTIIFSMRDFVKENKKEVIIILMFFCVILVFFGTYHAWHGLVAWGPRYLVPIIPFLLIPLAASLEKRDTMYMKILLISLGGVGILFNLAWLVQDVSWFVWGLMGSDRGLFSLGNAGMHPLRIHPDVLWTFEHSQLTNAIILLFTNLQVDLFYYNFFGPMISMLILGSILIPSILYLKKLLHTSKFQKELVDN